MERRDARERSRWQCIRQVILAAVFIFCCAACGFVGIKQELSLEQEVAIEARLVELLTTATLELRKGGEASVERAAAVLELAREIKPRDPRILDGLGCVEWHRGNLRLAEHFFKRAIAEDAQYDRGYEHLALIAEERGDLPAAEDLLDISLRLNPLNFRARNNRALLMLKNGSDSQSRYRAYQELLKAYASGARGETALMRNIRQLDPEFQ